MKPECSEYQTRIARLFMEDLTAEERHELEAHLAACPRCQSEHDDYARTLSLMQSVDNEPVPRHFFIQSEGQRSNPWELFRFLRPGWQVITAVFAGLFLLAGLGGFLGFARSGVDTAQLKKEFLKSAEQQNLRTMESYLREVRSEMNVIQTDLTQRQKAELNAALDRLDARMTGRLKLVEGRVQSEAQQYAVEVYRTVSQQRAQDLSLINFRFDGIEAKNTLETRQTDAILNTLLQVAELKLK